MSTKRPRRPARLPQVERPRDGRGRWLSKRQIAAYKGVQTKQRKAKIQAKTAREIRRAFDHGKAAREQSERRLTPKQRAARKRDANRIERETKKAPARQSRKTTGQAGRAEPKPPSIVSRSLIGSKRRTKASGRKSRPKRRRTSIATSRASNQVTFGTGSGDGLKVQIGVRAQLPAGMVPTNALLYEAIAYRLAHGEDHPRFKTKIIRWQNPGRKRGPLRQWRQGNQTDAWLTLGPAIAAAVGR